MRAWAQWIAATALLTWSTPAMAWSPWDWFRSENEQVEQGNEKLREGDHEEALRAYDAAAEELPKAAGVHLNRGLALMAQDRLPEAQEAFERALGSEPSRRERALAQYNLGLSHLEQAQGQTNPDQQEQAQKRLRSAVDAFRNSLRAQPGNRDAAWNLELARERLAQLQKQRQQQQQEDDQEEQQKQDQQEQDQQEQDQQEQDQEDQQKQDGEQGDPQQQDDEPQPGDAGQKPPQDQGEGDRDGGAPQKPQDAQQSPQDGKQQPPPEEQTGQQGQQPQRPGEPQGEEQMPREMRRVLDALRDSEENLQRLRARQRAMQRRRPVEKDW